MIALLAAATGAVAFLAAVRALHRMRLADEARFAAWNRQHAANSFERWQASTDRTKCNAIWNATQHSIPNPRKETGQ